MTFHTRYSQLNDKQKEAVDSLYGPVMVLAGPGSGKTELLSLRVANILREVDVFPRQVLCLTFTESGEKNMRDRLFGLIGKDAYQVSIHTFHGFASSVHARYKELFFDGIEMRIADDVEKKSILHDVLDSLPMNNPLRTKDPNGNFVYEWDISSSIQRLKNAGLTPDRYKRVLEGNEERYSQLEEVLAPLGQRVSKSMIPQLHEIVSYVESHKESAVDLSFFSYDQALYLSLSTVVKEAEETGKTNGITQWKSEWMEKDPKTGALRLKDAVKSEKQFALVEVYARYITQMKESGLIDFDDILLGLLTILEENPGVVADLQELYQFILVDEYQDTNDAQLKILQYLTRGVERPNILVVGDDDQAIYKFQGADVNNIYTFVRMYDDPTIIHLEKNYRSKKNIVDFSKEVIAGAEERASSVLLGKEKHVEANQGEHGHISLVTVNHAADEYLYIAKDIKRYLENGGLPSSVTVIARRHKTLQEMVPYFLAEGVDIRYEQRRNILEDTHIIELITLLELITEVNQDGPYFNQALLPVILQFGWIGIDVHDVWKISIGAYKRRTGKIAAWIDEMLEMGGDAELFAKDLLALAARATIEPFSDWIYNVIGSSSEEFPFISGRYKEYYFPALGSASGDALVKLSSLELFLATVRNMDASSGSRSVKSAFNVFSSYIKTGTAITDTTPYISGLDAVQLCTAHKTKGLEFSRVYIVNASQDGWAKSGGRKKLSFPKNVPIDIASDTGDDALRLFFVAITRAMNDVMFTVAKQDEKGRAIEKLEFLTDDILETYVEQRDEVDTSVEPLLTKVYEPLVTLEAAPFLKDVAEEMVLAPTHILNFLKIKDKGPELFFKNNLLRFPDKKNDSSVFGTAMHSVAEKLVELAPHRSSDELLEFVKSHLTQLLSEEWYDTQKIDLRVESGVRIWKQYLETKKELLLGDIMTEINLQGEGVHILGVPVTGRVDKVHTDGKELVVVDYKTSKPISSWNERDKDTQVKLEEYKMQLYLYKLLIEHSRRFAGYTVVAGKIEFLSEYDKDDPLVLDMKHVDEELDRVAKLILAIRKKILALDFPDVSGYSQDVSGYHQLIDDLIAGTI